MARTTRGQRLGLGRRGTNRRGGYFLFLFVFAFEDRDFLERIDADDDEGLGSDVDFEADLKDVNLVPKLSADCSISSLDATLAHLKELSEV